MSFAVFGASLDYCTKVARKRVKPVKGSGKNLVQLTAEEWEAEVTKYAQKLFDDIKAGKKTAPKISADMTQPSAANEFIALAKKNNCLRKPSDIPASTSERPDESENQTTNHEVSTVATGGGCRMKYDIIYADPAWQFNDANKNGNRGAGCKYDVMTLEQMKQLPVPDLAADNCTLFMWHVPAMPQEALDLVKAWGFELKTMKAFSWVKLNKRFLANMQKAFRVNKHDLQSMDESELLPLLSAAAKLGLGHWTRGNTEDCLIAVRGKPKRKAMGVRQLIIEPIREHSRKPDCTRDRIVELMGDVPRVELFARQNHHGWDAWGNECSESIILTTAYAA